MSASGDLDVPLSLDEISTHHAVLRDPLRFTMRYAPAIRQYLVRLLRNENDADDAAQEFLLKVVERGFDRVQEDRGRFRHYLKVSVRNAALNFLRQRKQRARHVQELQDDLIRDDLTRRDDAWIAACRQCLIEEAWRSLKKHESQHEGNLFHTVLLAAASNPDVDQNTLSRQVSEATGRALTLDAFRKQLSRARRFFGRLLLTEIAHTLDHPTAATIREEVTELGLLPYVEPLLGELERMLNVAK